MKKRIDRTLAPCQMETLSNITSENVACNFDESTNALKVSRPSRMFDFQTWKLIKSRDRVYMHRSDSNTRAAEKPRALQLLIAV